MPVVLCKYIVLLDLSEVFVTNIYFVKKLEKTLFLLSCAIEKIHVEIASITHIRLFFRFIFCRKKKIYIIIFCD